MGKIVECRCCQSKRLIPFFDLGEQPLANALLERQDSPEKAYSLALAYCADCGLVQLDYTVDPQELFTHYVWVTSTSGTARCYARQFRDRALARLEGEPVRYVLEAASNDGTFLKPFQEKGMRVLGVDPAENIAEMANRDGIPTRAEFFSEEVADAVIAELGKPSIVFARNVLPHVSSPHGFLNGLAKCCAEDTLCVLETHYSGSILDELHYDSIYHEHLCYFTLRTLSGLLERHGLFAFDLEWSPISGGSTVLYLKNHPTGKSARLLEMETSEREKGYNTLECWQGFARDSREHSVRLRELVEGRVAGRKKILGYGASARSSTLLNACGINAGHLAAVADQNPLKQGMFTPGSRIPILSPDKALAGDPDSILLLAWNFREEIMAILRDTYGYRGEVIVPLPNCPRVEVVA